MGNVSDSLIIITFGICVFIFGLYLFKKKRLIEDIPTSKIRSIAMGLVEIYGKIVPADKILTSPFTQKNCVYYRYLIERLENSEKSSKWVKIKEGEDRTLFYLQDETGKVLVDPKGAEIDIPPSFEFTSGIGKDPPQQIKNFLQANKISFEGFLGINKTMRFREYILEPNNNLYIMGTAGDNPFMEEGWAQTGIEDVMIQKGENIYYISDKSEKEVVKRLGWQSVLSILGGALLIVFGVLNLLK
jgi:hypothetical protein